MANLWERTVTVAAGRYATVMACLEAKRVYGDEYTASGVLAETANGRRMVYSVVLDRQGPSDGSVLA